MLQDLAMINRRTFLKSAAAGTLIYPATSWGASEKPVKIGSLNPRTGSYAALGDNQVRGAKLAVDELNQNGGILGRPVQLIIEDSQARPGPAVSKAEKLLNKDKVDMLIGSVSSGVSEAISQMAYRKGVLYVDSGGHADAVTGSKCHWTTFRTCSTTWLLTAGDFETIFKKYGKRWFFITPDYAYGHALVHAYKKQLKKAGGVVLGNALAPVGTTNFSSYLVRARAANPDVLLCLPGGDDLVNLLKQAVQFGMNKKMGIAGAQMEMEDLEALPKSALLGWWTMEWYWKQPKVPEVAEFVKKYKSRPDSHGKVPTARVWFGYASVHAVALAAAKAKSIKTMSLVKAMEGLELPPNVALQPGKVYYRAGDHQLLGNMYPGYIPKDASYPNMFHVADVVNSANIALSPTERGCNMTYPG